jgi:hypothetical protein
MNPSFFNWTDIRDLLARSLPQRLALQHLYARLPATRCRRQAHCCAMLPEMSLTEALTALDRMQRFPPDQRGYVLKKMVRYFLINPLEITACPFLEGADCLIYEDRFFGCRAYGLWSPEEYARRAGANRQAKSQMREQWLRLGVRLPAAVVDFQVPYCSQVVTAGAEAVTDTSLLETEEEVERLSEPLDPGHQRFRDLYFTDLSFLLAGLILGTPEALRLKFTLVKEGLPIGRPDRLDEVILNLEGRADLFF